MHDWTRRIAEHLHAAGHPVQDDVVEELSQHAAAAYESARAEGLDPHDAIGRVESLIRGWTELGAGLTHRTTRVQPVNPPASSGSRVAGLMHDLRYAWRLVWRRPGPALVAALTMALGIGATTTLFSVMWGVLMKPPGIAEVDRVIRLRESREGATRTYPWSLTNGAYLAWSERPTTVEALAACSVATVTLTGTGDPQRVQVLFATASLFSVIQAVPQRGSLFTAADEATANVAVISHRFWQQQLAGAEDVIGRKVSFDGKPYTIAGVLPPSVAFPDRETVAVLPLQVRPSRTPDGGSWIQLLAGIARLRPGVTPAQAADEATARARSAPDPGLAVVAVFGSKGAPVVQAERLLDAATGDVRDALWVLLAAVGLLLATATANIASVQLARAAVRRRELAIRVSLGASNRRIARQLVFETLVIGTFGGAGGLALSMLLHGALPALLPADFPRAAEIALDRRVLLFAVVVTVLSSLVAGLVPALQARRLAPRTALAEDASATGGGVSRRGVSRVRAAIMAGQVAVACVLLVGAALLGRTFVAMLAVDRGYDPANVLTVRVASPDGLFTPERRTAMITRVLERLREDPRVVAAGAVNNLPLTPGEAMMAVTIPPTAGDGSPRQVRTGIRVVSPGYLEAMGMRLLEGRTFSEADTPASRPAVIVNRAFADGSLGGRAAGGRLPFTLYDRDDWQIVGIVDNVRMRAALDDPPGPEMFVAYTQTGRPFPANPVIVARTTGDPAALTADLRRIVAAQEPSAALESVMTMEDRIADSLARPRLYAAVLIGFALFAVAIAGVGLFGVLSYSVAQRSRELGIRLALGAQRRQIVGMIVREGIAIGAAGIAIGLGIALLSARALRSVLYGVEAHDLLTLVLVPAVLLLVAVLACAVPAARASRADPMTALKST